MFSYQPETGLVTFSCTKCADKIHTCLSCSQERAVYDVAYKDGKLGNPYEDTGFNQAHSQIYKTGYNNGVADRKNSKGVK